MVALYIFLLTTPYLVSGTGNDFNNAETRLLQDLFSNYSSVIRPSKTKHDPVNMTFGVAYVQLIELNDAEQFLVSNVWIRQKWKNYHLRWDPEKYENIKSVNVDPSKVWLPDVVLYNNAMEGRIAGTMYLFKTKVILTHDGTNTWYSPMIIRSGCSLDVTYFPFDEQICELVFGSWTFSGNHLDLYPMQDKADLTAYLESTDFLLMSAHCTRIAPVYSGVVYPNIVFKLHLQRQPGFFFYNVIIPGFVIASIAIMTFSCPKETGERISLNIDTFLTLSFLMMGVSDTLPVSSDATPLISKSLMLYAVLIFMVLFCNMLTLSMKWFDNEHNRAHRRVPKWMRVVFFEVIGPMVGYTDGRSSNLKKEWLERGRYIKAGNKNEVMSLVGKAVGELNRHRVARYEKHRQRKEFSVNQFGSHTARRGELLPLGISMQGYQKCVNDMEDVLMRSWVDMDNAHNVDWWRCFAQSIDRLFMLLFCTIFVFFSAIMLWKGYGHQSQVQSQVKGGLYL